MPLVHQIPNRCDDQRRQASLGNDREGYLGLARTRGHNDDAVSWNRPSIEGLLLLGTERRQLILRGETNNDARRSRIDWGNLIDDPRLVVGKNASDGSVVISIGSPLQDSVIPSPHAGAKPSFQLPLASRVICTKIQKQRTSIEAQSWRFLCEGQKGKTPTGCVSCNDRRYLVPPSTGITGASAGITRRNIAS
jgi:hypothetical protein